jgi:hypothetical protein
MCPEEVHVIKKGDLGTKEPFKRMELKAKTVKRIKTENK